MVTKVFASVVAAGLLQVQAHPEKWQLRSNTIDFHGAQLGGFNKPFDTQKACEEERKMIVDYITEMQPQLVYALNAVCVYEQ